MSDVNILQNAHYRYWENNHDTSFNHEKCWDVLKTSPKWDPIPLVKSTVRPSKQRKTLESTTGSCRHTFFLDLNDDNDDDAEADPIVPTRPVGRNRGKRASSTSTGTGSKKSVTTLLGELSEIHTKNDKLIEVRQKALELQASDRMEKDYEFYIWPTNHLSGSALSNTLRMKEEIRQKYNWDPL